MNLLSQLVLTLALLLGCRFALAQIPPTQHSAGISYILGGVGEEETIAIWLRSNNGHSYWSYLKLKTVGVSGFLGPISK